MGEFRIWLEAIEETYATRLARAFDRYLRWYRSEKQQGNTPTAQEYMDRTSTFARQEDVSPRDLRRRAKERRMRMTSDYSAAKEIEKIRKAADAAAEEGPSQVQTSLF